MGPEDLEWQFYRVVVNAEEHYSIWRDDRENPLGWRNAGFSGTREECLAYIKQVWNDRQPPGKKIVEEKTGVDPADG
jgi:MbtH protein